METIYPKLGNQGILLLFGQFKYLSQEVHFILVQLLTGNVEDHLVCVALLLPKDCLHLDDCLGEFHSLLEVRGAQFAMLPFNQLVVLQGDVKGDLREGIVVYELMHCFYYLEQQLMKLFVLRVMRRGLLLEELHLG